MFGLMKIKKFAAELEVPESTIYTWRKRKNIPEDCFIQIGGTWFVRVKATQEWLANVRYDS